MRNAESLVAAPGPLKWIGRVYQGQGAADQAAGRADMEHAAGPVREGLAAVRQDAGEEKTVLEF